MVVSAGVDVAVVGSVNLDVSLAVERLPSVGQTVLSSSSVQGLGGKGANQAVAAAAFGATCALIAALGDDDAADWLLARLEERHVDIGSICRTPGPSGQAYVVVDAAGSNQIVVAPNSNRALSVSDVERALQHSPAAAVVTQLEIGVDAAASAIDWAHRAGRIAILNAAPAVDIDRSTLRKTSLLIVNEGEATAMTGSDDVREASAELRGWGVAAVLISVGARGVLLDAADEGGPLLIAAPPVANVVDTTGAGDVLTGAMAARLGRGDSLRSAAQLGVAAASWSVQRAGVCAPGLADLA
jgi:ribokinase